MLTEVRRTPPGEDRPGGGERTPGAPVSVRVPAKINLYLGVGPRRADGYHELVTVFHAIGRYDELIIEPGGPALIVEGDPAGEVPTDDRNLAVRAVAALAGQVGRSGDRAAVRMLLRKRIPVAGGLAGGSANAAAALVAANALWRTGRTTEELAAVAATLGSDVGFGLYGGTALGTGRGEVITPLGPEPATTWHWVIAAAPGGLSTPAVYAELDRLRAIGLVEERPPEVPESLVLALAKDDPAALGAALHNDLQPAALSLRPELSQTLAAGQAAGAVAGIVSGSGPTCVFLAEDGSAADRLADRLAATPGCRAAIAVTGPVPGAELIGATGAGPTGSGSGGEH